MRSRFQHMRVATHAVLIRKSLLKMFTFLAVQRKHEERERQRNGL